MENTIAETIKSLMLDYANIIESATTREQNTGYDDFEDTVARIDAKGAYDALKLLALNLGFSDFQDMPEADAIEDRVVTAYDDHKCEHGRFSTSPNPAIWCGMEIVENRCDNCNKVIYITL